MKKVVCSFEDMQSYLGGKMAICDGIRGIAILMVVILHTRALRIPLPKVLDWLYGIGWCGVDLFFVLSGFLITGILLQSKHDPRYYRHFYVRRFLRIFPLYYLVLTMTFWGIPVIAAHAPPEFAEVITGYHGSHAWYWFYLSNIGSALFNVQEHPMLGVVWSLAIEEQFYAVWPLVVRRFTGRTIMSFCLVIMIFCFLLRIVLTGLGIDRFSIYTFTFTRFDGLAFGALIALALRDREWFPRCREMAKTLLPLGVAGFIGAAVVGGGVGYTISAMQVVGYTSLALIFGSFMLLAVSSDVTGGSLSRILRFRLFTWYGGLCYGLYLLHAQLIQPLRPIFLDHLSLGWVGHPIIFQMLFTVIMLPACTILPWLSWRYFESPILKLKRYFEYDKRKSNLRDISPEKTSYDSGYSIPKISEESAIN
jgi:peptidoglycan/LPS O-acetylase OafA/YrhL